MLSIDEFNRDQDPDFGGWYRTPKSVDFVLSTPFYPTATEVEVFDTALKSRGVFDVDPLIDAFCENNPGNPQCEERKKRFYEVLDFGQSEDILGSVVVDFDEYEHYDGWGEGVIEVEDVGMKISSSNPETSSLLAIDMAKTDLDETYLNAGYYL